MRSASRFSIPTSLLPDTSLAGRTGLASLAVVGLLIYLSTHGYIPFLMSVDQTQGDKDGALGIATQALFLVIVAILALPYSKRMLNAAHYGAPLFAIAVLTVCSTAWSQDPALTARRSVMLLGPTVLALFLHVRYKPERQIDLALWAGVFGAILSILITLRFPSVGVDPTMHDGSWQGIFPQKNVCARACVFTMLIAFIYLGRSGKKHITALAVLPVLAALLYKTNSITGWILAGVVLVSVYALRWLRRLPPTEAFVVGIVAVAAVAGLLVFVSTQFDFLLALFGKDSTLTGRTAIWDGAIEAILKHPFLGYGYSAFWMGMKGESANVVLATKWLVPAAHDGFLDIWLQLGGVGLILFLISLIQGCRAALWCLRHGGGIAAEWGAGIMLLTVLYNLDETSLLIPRELLWVLYSLAFLNVRAMMVRQKAALFAEAQYAAAVRREQRIAHSAPEAVAVY